MHAHAIFVAASSAGAVTGAREAAVATLVLLVLAVTVRVAKPVLRRRHARLLGATPQEALLLAGLGEVVRPEAAPVEPVVAITILPAKEQRERDEADRERVLGDADARLVELLGPDHAMSAPGRHRTAVGWATVLQRVDLHDVDAEALLAPASASEAAPADLEVEPDGVHDESQDDASPRNGADDEEQPAAMATAETDQVTTAPRAASAASPAARRYAIDWGEDWTDLDAVPHPDGWEDGWVAARGETWHSAPAARVEPVADRRPDAAPSTLPAPSTPAAPALPAVRASEPPVAAEEVEQSGSTLALWWSEIENSGVAFETAADVLAEQGQGAVPAPLPVHAPDETPADAKVPAPRHPGQPSGAQRDRLAGAQARLSDADNRIAVAQIVTEEARALVRAETAALIVRSIEGPRVLSLDPAGAEIWGPQTLAALLGSGAVLREVLENDPLADGEATALLVVPVASAGAHVGAIVVRRPGARPFAAPEQNLLDRLARMTGVALDTLTRRGVLRTGDEHLDQVTGLAPQDRLLHDLRVALRTREDHGMAVSLVVAEVDGLAHLRTEQGAEQADDALVLIADTVASSLRVGDVAYRLGSDELAVLLAATEIEDGEQVAARLADEVGTACAETLQQARPLRLRTAVVSVVGTAEDVVSQANQALAAARVQARWERRMPTQY